MVQLVTKTGVYLSSPVQTSTTVKKPTSQNKFKIRSVQSSDSGDFGSQGFCVLTDVAALPLSLPPGILSHQMDLNKTEDVIGKLETLHQQPHLWDFLLLLPRLYANNFHIADGVLGGEHLLHAVLR